MNDEQTSTEQPVDAPPVEVVQRNDAPAREAQSQEPRRRLRELTAIPDRDRTDAVWDEIIELEIQLAPGNRALSPQAEKSTRLPPTKSSHGCEKVLSCGVSPGMLDQTSSPVFLSNA